MKRNVILGVVLVLMLWGGWYGEHREKEVPGALGAVDWEEVVAIKIPSVVLKKLPNGWVEAEKGKEVDGDKVQELWTAIGEYLDRERGHR